MKNATEKLKTTTRLKE